MGGGATTEKTGKGTGMQWDFTVSALLDNIGLSVVFWD